MLAVNGQYADPRSCGRGCCVRWEQPTKLARGTRRLTRRAQRPAAEESLLVAVEESSQADNVDTRNAAAAPWYRDAAAAPWYRDAAAAPWYRDAAQESWSPSRPTAVASSAFDGVYSPEKRAPLPSHPPPGETAPRQRSSPAACESDAGSRDRASSAKQPRRVRERRRQQGPRLVSEAAVEDGLCWTTCSTAIKEKESWFVASGAGRD